MLAFIHQYTHDMKCRLATRTALFQTDSKVIIMGVQDGLVYIVSHDATEKADYLVNATSIDSCRIQQSPYLFICNKEALVCMLPLDNSEIFRVSCRQGINYIKTGILREELVFAVGQTFVKGYNMHGKQVLVQHVSDRIAAIGQAQISGNSNQDLIIGFGHKVRVYNQSKLLLQMTFTTSVSAIGSWKQLWSVGCEDGSLSMYKQRDQITKFQGKGKINGIIYFTPLKQKEIHVIIWRDNNKLELINSKGKSVNRITVNGGILDVKVCDFRGQGQSVICAITKDGSIKAFKVDKKQQTKGPLISQQKQQILRSLNELSNQNEMLTKQYEQIKKKNTEIDSQLPVEEPKVQSKLTFSPEGTLVLNSNWFIQALTFDIPIQPVICQEGTKKLVIPLGGRDFQETFIMNIVISRTPLQTGQNRILTKNMKVNKYYKWLHYTPKSKPPIKGQVYFALKQKMSRLIMWLQSLFVFNLGDKREQVEDQTSYSFFFINKEINKFLQIQYQAEKCLLTLRVDDIQFAGLLIQDIADFTKLRELNCQCTFPQIHEQLKRNFKIVEEYQKDKFVLSGQISNSVDIINSNLFAADQFRAIQQYKQMNVSYRQILSENKKVFLELEKRQKKLETVRAALLRINWTMKMFANLRIGESRRTMLVELKSLLNKNLTSDFLLLTEKGHL